MHSEVEDSITRRKLLLHDSLAFFSLVLITVLLFVITLFLFRSFSDHRSVLARRWSDRGRADLQANRPDAAIVDLHTALTYAPGTRAYEELLAQALGAAGHTEESYQYFMSLWDAEPGSGPINLQLARLAKKRNDRQAAVRFYHAAIYGTWEGDGVARRADTRLELARYLIASHDLSSARLELLTAGGNAPGSYDLYMTLGDLLQQAADSGDAWTYYRKAIAAKPGDPAALEAAGRLAYQSGDFEDAYRMFERVQEAHETRSARPALSPDDLAMMNSARRMLELIPSPSLPARARVARILTVRAIARQRFDSCAAKFAQADALPPILETLSGRWDGPDGTSKAADLLRDSSQQDAAVQLAYDTEIQTPKLCGPPTGDDALLFRLATTTEVNVPPASSGGAPTSGLGSER